ncbi:MAG: hypothetical protein ACRCTY_08610 [Candidatus Adiutrix sp.]
MGVIYATDLAKFAEQIVWFMPPAKVLADKNYFLVHLMAKASKEAYEHLRARFPQFSDADFITALRNAPLGIFMYEEDWHKWNEKFGLIPPLPFPRKYPQ